MLEKKIRKGSTYNEPKNMQWHAYYMPLLSTLTVSPLGRDIDLFGRNSSTSQIFPDKLFAQTIRSGTVKPRIFGNFKQFVHYAVRLLLHQFDGPIISKDS
jgi:hypothetical protein